MKFLKIYFHTIYRFAELDDAQVWRDSLPGCKYGGILEKINSALTNTESLNTAFAFAGTARLEIIFADGKFHCATAQKVRRVWRREFGNSGFPAVPQECELNLGRSWSRVSGEELRFTPETRTQAVCTLLKALRYAGAKLRSLTRTRAEWEIAPRAMTVADALKRAERSHRYNEATGAVRSYASLRHGNVEFEKLVRERGCARSTLAELVDGPGKADGHPRIDAIPLGCLYKSVRKPNGEWEQV